MKTIKEVCCKCGQIAKVGNVVDDEKFTVCCDAMFEDMVEQCKTVKPEIAGTKYNFELTKQEIETILDVLRDSPSKDVYDLFTSKVLDVII
jgi:hypothetical protein